MPRRSCYGQFQWHNRDNLSNVIQHGQQHQLRIWHDISVRVTILKLLDSSNDDDDDDDYDDNYK